MHTIVLASSKSPCPLDAEPSSAPTPNKGYVQAYRFDSGTSQFIALGSKIFGKENRDGFGWSVDITDDGMYVAVGAPFRGNERGYAQVYRFDTSNSDWEEVGDFEGPAPQTDSISHGEGQRLGAAVALSGSGPRVAIGSSRWSVRPG